MRRTRERRLTLSAHRGNFHRPAPRCLLSEILFWAAVACCAVAQVAIIRASLRAPTVVSSAVPRPHRAIEIAWTVLPAVGLAIALAATWGAIRAHRAHADPPAGGTAIERGL